MTVGAIEMPELPPSRQGKKSFVVWMTPEMHFALKEIALHTGKSFNDLAIEGLEHVSAKYRKKLDKKSDK